MEIACRTKAHTHCRRWKRFDIVGILDVFSECHSFGRMSFSRRWKYQKFRKYEFYWLKARLRFFPCQFNRSKTHTRDTCQIDGVLSLSPSRPIPNPLRFTLPLHSFTSETIKIQMFHWMNVTRTSLLSITTLGWSRRAKQYFVWIEKGFCPIYSKTDKWSVIKPKEGSCRNAVHKRPSTLYRCPFCRVATDNNHLALRMCALILNGKPLISFYHIASHRLWKRSNGMHRFGRSVAYFFYSTREVEARISSTGCRSLNPYSFNIN